MPEIAPTTRVLANGVEIPRLAFGAGTAWYTTSQASNPQLIASVVQALKVGYRHIDCAEMYGTDRDVGTAIAQFLHDSGLTRSHLFVTSKVFKSVKDVRGCVKESLERLQLEYLDLFLIHAPFFKEKGIDVTLADAWKAMESLVDDGLVRSIGVSNCRISDLEHLLKIARIRPVVNQVECHPYLQQPELAAFCNAHGIVIECYGALAPLRHSPGGPVDAMVSELAAKYGRTPAQILLRWNYQRGNVVVTTSSNPDRLREFLAVPDFALEPTDAARIDDAGAQFKYRKFWRPEFEACGL